MERHEVIDLMRELKLVGMKAAYDKVLSNALTLPDIRAQRMSSSAQYGAGAGMPLSNIPSRLVAFEPPAMEVD